MTKAFLAALFAAFHAAVPSAEAEHFDIVYPKNEGNARAAYNFGVEALKLAMDKIGADYTAHAAPEVLEQGHAISALEHGEGINLIWFGMSADTELRLRPIRVPLFRGLIGHRIFIIAQERQKDFDKVSTLQDLKKFTAGQGLGWPDVEILKAAGLQVTATKYDRLFDMLSVGRIDYFPRGAFEPFKELEAHANTHPNLVLEQHITLVYPYDVIFYTRKADEALAAAIEKGLRLAYEDGSYMELFHGNPELQAIEKAANLTGRIRIDIPNPLLSEEDKDIPMKYWMQE